MTIKELKAFAEKEIDICEEEIVEIIKDSYPGMDDEIKMRRIRKRAFRQMIAFIKGDLKYCKCGRNLIYKDDYSFCKCYKEK